MNDDELTRLAVAQLIAEGEKFKQRHELRYRLEEPSRLKPNIRYFRNTLRNCISSNSREEKMRSSKAADELRCLDKHARKRKIDDEIDSTDSKLSKRDFTLSR